MAVTVTAGRTMKVASMIPTTCFSVLYSSGSIGVEKRIL